MIYFVHVSDELLEFVDDILDDTLSIVDGLSDEEEDSPSLNITADRIDRELEMPEDIDPIFNFLPRDMEQDNEVGQKPEEGNDEEDNDQRDPNYDPELEEEDLEEDDDWDVGGAQAPPFDPRGAWNISPDFDPLPAAPPYEPANLVPQRVTPIDSFLRLCS